MTTNRRAFLRLATGATCAVAAAPSLVGCASIPVHRAQAIGQTLALSESEYAAVRDDQGVILLTASGLVAPVALIEGEPLTALSMLCTHMECNVRPGGNQFVCPCHGSAFDRSGAVVRGPAERALREYRVERADGSITVYLSE